MIKIVLVSLSGYVALVAMDLLWIGLLASGFYRSQLGHLMRIEQERMAVNIPAALATWAIMIAGLCLFVHIRVPEQGALYWHGLWGALFGVALYGVYNLTNMAVLRDWPLSVVLVDIAWGAVVCSCTAMSMGLARQVLERFGF